MSRVRVLEAGGTRRPLHLVRSAANLVLPMDAQLMISNVLQSQWIRMLDPADVQTVKTWLSDVDNMTLDS
jgi:hypothetical protein